MASEVLQAQHILSYEYKRSLGPLLQSFFDGLAEHRILGARSPSGKVLCPPMEYDPDTAEPVTETVEVGPGGIVTTWAWVNAPRPKHPLQKPFAWALIRLDRADTALVHAVDAGSEDAMSSGMRVVPRWADEPTGSILDLACFVPEDA